MVNKAGSLGKKLINQAKKKNQTIATDKVELVFK